MAGTAAAAPAASSGSTGGERYRKKDKEMDVRESNIGKFFFVFSFCCLFDNWFALDSGRCKEKVEANRKKTLTILVCFSRKTQSLPKQ